MIGASKILTVSYGTFSCTLEGFDDPFNTMKAIAEYFRDLAAEDRYFGAEPPQPDAAMLHRIAEREIQRRVEARVEDNSVYLRQADSASDTPAAVPVELASAELATNVVAPAVPQLLPADEGMEAVATRLARLRAQGAAAPAPAPVDAPVDAPVIAPVDAAAWGNEAYSEDEHNAPSDGFALPLAAEPAAPPQLTAEPAEVLAPSVLDQAMDLVEAEAPVLAAVEPLPEWEDRVAVDLGDLQDRPATEAAVQVAAVETASDDILDNVLSALGNAEIAAAPVAVVESVLSTTAAADSARAQVVSSYDDEAGIDFSGLDLSDSPAPVIAPPAAADAELSTPETAPELAPELAPVVAPEPQAAAEMAKPEVPAPVQRARARVIRIRRAEADALNPIARDAVIEGAATAPAAAPQPDKKSTLTAEAEAELLAELAALEQETAPPAATTVSTDIVAPRRPVSTARRSDTPAPAASQEATRNAEVELERIIARANSALGDASNQRRHSAIQHLKAAVAATEADRAANGGQSMRPPTPEADFRQDLNRAVGSGGNNTARPAGDRPAPLVLVSAQRIDRQQGQMPAAANEPGRVLPVRPVRRNRGSASVAALQPQEIDVHAPLILTGGPAADRAADQADDPAEERGPGTENFPEFVRLLGATTLVELVEAAAVFRATVQDQPAFRRASLSSVIASLGGPEVPKPDFFAAFGQLVEKGYLSEIDGGRYALTNRSPYLRVVENDE